MKKNKRGSILWLVLVFISVFSVVSLVLLSYYSNFTNNYYVSYKKLQASNYATEWIEMFKWYVSTVVNKDRIEWWEKNIQPLNWEYVISFDNIVWYSIQSQEKEVIEEDDPYVVDYVRTIEVYDWDNSSEKKVTVTVDYGERNKVSYDTTLVDLY